MFEKIFAQKSYIDYLTADLNDPDVMVQMDITEINYPAHSFDVIYCSHVLEHVPEDRRAMQELFRVLAPGGWAVLQVPITADATFEDPSITDPREREKIFGQHDHVRCYGPDYQNRLEAAGFHVNSFSAEKVVGKANLGKLGVQADENVYYCTKCKNCNY
jgi:predicted SAM-dependent methyltransferase